MHFSIGSLHLYDRHFVKARALTTARFPLGGDQLSDVRFLPRGDSPADRFTGFERLVKEWMALEHHLRTMSTPGVTYSDESASAIFRAVRTFPEPLLRAWLHVLAWWWTGQRRWLTPLEGTTLLPALGASPQTAERREAAQWFTAAYGTLEPTPETTDARPEAGQSFADYAADLHAEKHAVYGDSWKRRGEQVNWFDLQPEERGALMKGHGMIGRKYAGQVTQVISGSVGLDDWEWGVTLWARNPVFLKDIVHSMRFDEASAKYGLFGDFYFGYVLPPAELADTLRI